MSDHHDVIIHGHRGWRGSYPENSITGFIEATRLGVDALELDIVIDANHQIIVSHDPFMQHEICVKPDGSAITAEEEILLNIYRMQDAERLLYSNPPPVHPRFPDQKRVTSAVKPTLNEVVHAVTAFCDSIKRDIPLWNIEIKSQPDWDDIFHPQPREYVAYFLAQLRQLQLEDHCVVQSFDARILNEMHQQSPDVKLVYLSDAPEVSPEEKLSALGFKPFGYSPNFKLVTKETFDYCKKNDIELIVWTVNEESDMQAMIDLGVKHIITDYPERLMKLLKRKS